MVILWFATACHLFSLAGVLAAPIGTGSARLGRAPWALTQGLLLSLLIRHGTGSPGLMDATSPTGLVFKVVCCALGIVDCLILGKEAAYDLRHQPAPAVKVTGADELSGRADGSPLPADREEGRSVELRALESVNTVLQLEEEVEGEPPVEADVGLPAAQQSSGKVWAMAALVGLQLGATWSLSLWLLTGPTALPHFVGRQPIRHSTALVMLMLAGGIGVPLAAMLHRLLMFMWASVWLLGGMALLLHGSSEPAFAGALLLALALPAAWCLTLSNVRRLALQVRRPRVLEGPADPPVVQLVRVLNFSCSTSSYRAPCASSIVIRCLYVQGGIGRAFGLGGLTVAVLFWGYAGVLLGEAARPVTGQLFCGSFTGFGWAVAGAWWVSIAVEYLLYRLGVLQKDVGTNGTAGTWAPFVEKKNSVAAAIMLGFLSTVALGLVLLIAATEMEVLFGLAEAGLAAPSATADFTVATINVQQGFDNNGRSNHDCLRAIISGLAHGAANTTRPATSVAMTALPMVISLQDSDGNHWFSGGTDPTGVLARQLGLFAFYGPAGRQGGLGLSLLSRLRIRPGSTGSVEFAELGRMVAEQCQSERQHFTHAVVETGGSSYRGVHVLNAKLGGGGGQAAAVAAAISELAVHAAGLAGPVVITGDFAVHPNGTVFGDRGGGSGGSSAWQPLLAAGFQSVTPLNSTTIFATVAHTDSSGSAVQVGAIACVPPLAPLA